MDALSIHLMVNHVPLLAILLGTVLVVLATFIRRRSLWRVGTAALVVAGLSFYPVQWTGGNAEHVEASERALWVVLLAGAVAAYAFWRASRGPVTELPVVPAWLRGAVVVTALAASAASVKTAWEAGFIAHKNPLLDRATLPPADSVPVKAPRPGPPPQP